MTRRVGDLRSACGQPARTPARRLLGGNTETVAEIASGSAEVATESHQA
jgi:hypothetical protein